MMALLLLLWTARADQPGFAHRLDPTLRALQDLRAGRAQVGTPELDRRAALPTVEVSVRFAAPLAEAELRRWEATGLRFSRQQGEILRVGAVYPAEARWEVLDALARDARVVRVESARKLGALSPLNVSAPEIEATVLWETLGGGGAQLDGRGVRVLDLDSGIDVFHPSFFRPDGGNFNWLDTDGDGGFTDGVDAVDLDGDGAAGADETLTLLDAGSDYTGWASLLGSDGALDAGVDWVFVDTDGDGARTYGPNAGYTDADPAFGEPIFIVEDEDGDGALDVGERLLLLGSSKIVATVDYTDAEVHEAGDISGSEVHEDNNHGTAVSAILAGEYTRYRALSGVAPSAELMMADIFGEMDQVEAIAWGLDAGAAVMLHEIGWWAWSFLDGSENTQAAIGAAWDAGVVQVCPMGNVGDGYRHGEVSVPADGSWHGPYWMYFPEYMSWYGATTIWWTLLSQDDLSGLRVALGRPEGYLSGSAYYLYPSFGDDSSCVYDSEDNWFCGWSDESDRGTEQLAGYLSGWTSTEGYFTPTMGWWEVWFANSGAAAADLHVWVADDGSSWSGGATWYGPSSSYGASYIGEVLSSLVAPSDADACIGVGSYATRDWTGAADAGSYDLSGFSGRGPRIDGDPGVDVAAPGNWDIWAGVSSQAGYGYGWYSMFSGTSAAGPHPTGAAALLLQAAPELGPDEVEAALQDGALADDYTGASFPDPEWGYGKLRALGAVLAADRTPPTVDTLTLAHPLLAEAAQVVVAPSESLAEAPTLAVTVDGAAVEAEPVEAAIGWWVATVPAGEASVSVSGEDLAGNAF